MRVLAGLFIAVLAACSAQSEPVFHAQGNPQALSDWAQFSIDRQHLTLADDVLPYDLNTPLFTDYALKLRTVWMPSGEAASYKPDAVFDFPVGTVITKTFYYPTSEDWNVLKNRAAYLSGQTLALDSVQLIETRVLARRDAGWIALPYVWNAEQTDATLQRTGDVKRLTLEHDGMQTPFSYVVPNVNQCAGCHAVDSKSRDVHPIGPKARHLNRDFDYGEGVQSQLAFWQASQRLSGVPDNAPQNANWENTNADLNARARAYLDMNCSHCHSESGPADTSGLHLTPDTPLGPNLGICKTPIAAGRGTGNRKYGIVPGNAEASIFSYRIESTRPDVMMPELGRALPHSEGAALIREWINGLDGACETPSSL